MLEECHYRGDEGRGTVWEEIIVNAPREVQLVGLSATVANVKEIADWISLVHGPVVAIEQETVSKPVPDKVLDDMRSCDAAIIHVGTDKKMMDVDGKEHKMLNQNVLIEIGAAMALYGRKFILLVEKGATLPSNLQGLYEVRYEGEKLDYEATMKLLKAFSDFRG